MDIADPQGMGFSSDRLNRIEAFFEERYIQPGLLPNMQVIVAREGTPVYHAKLGTLTGDESAAALPDDAIFRIASMTKPITSIAFMQLVEQCKVALEDPISRVLPELRSLGVYTGGGGGSPFLPGQPARPIRFVDLMTHMAGLTYGLQNRTNVDAAYRDARLDLPRGLSADEYLATLAEIPLQHEPGERWNYSVATDVLGVAVERISGQKLGDYFRQHIFEPLGMTDTGFDLAETARGRLADSFAYVPGSKAIRIETAAQSDHFSPASFHSGGGGLAGTAMDYHRFCAMLLNGGALNGARIISPKTLKLMTTNHLPGGADLTEMSDALFSEANNAGTGFGLGFAVVTDPSRTLMPASMGEYYWGGAYSTAFFVDPVERISMVFMTQLYPSSVHPIRRQIKTLIYSALEESYA